MTAPIGTFGGIMFGTYGASEAGVARHMLLRI
jgi:hypothetical protein